MVLCLAFVLPEVCEEVGVAFRAAGWTWALVRAVSAVSYPFLQELVTATRVQ